MPNIYRKISIEGLTGTQGDTGYYTTRSGKTIITEAAHFDSKRPCRDTQSRAAAIQDAATFANFARTQDVYLDRECSTGVSAYYIALADWFSAPNVLQIDVDAWTGRPGQTIRVKARDNVAVTGVTLTIRDAQENVLESGEAVQTRPGSPWWKYTTTSCARMEPFPIVEATARDLPGNEDTFVIS